eukprot:GHRR01009239.1.p1 GENE.GHRR01009239.1~~GHRR01009239.1.p1  ORF type:complete len:373 (+),score=125.77 GHRR01009239.1:739-1857(+)
MWLAPLITIRTAAGSIWLHAPTAFCRDPEQPIALEEWIEVFRKSIRTFKSHASTDPTVSEAQREAQADQFAQKFSQALDTLLSNPNQDLPGHSAGPVSCITLVRVREHILHKTGFQDIFKSVKDTENEAALQLLPQVLQQLDEHQIGRERLEAAIRGLFAGNIFDLGAAASAERYEAGGGVGFQHALEQLHPRPWVIDDLDAVLQHFSNNVYHKAILFVDNAGADVLLGMLPFARELLKVGTKVILAANNGPTINDMTAAELTVLIDKAAAMDQTVAAAWASKQLQIVNSGSDLPVIDLSKVSQQLADEAADADLLVLEGMGRAIETNLYAIFTVDSLKLGMIKHPEVAACLGGRQYDCVCKFDRGQSISIS